MKEKKENKKKQHMTLLKIFLKMFNKKSAAPNQFLQFFLVLQI